jgi:hypothetical protein
MTYYINLITNEVLHEKPASASIMNPTPVSQAWSDFGTAVMPRARALRKMGRFDLHNAVCLVFFFLHQFVGSVWNMHTL